MKVFVAGATGAVGRPLVRQLLEAGHVVTGMTRSPEKARALEEAGARAAVCDAYDREGVIAAVTAAQPDALVHQLTDLPPTIDADGLAANNRIRREATPHLLEAAEAAGVKRIVAQSMAFIYMPGEGPANESAPVQPYDPAATMVEVERAVVEAGGLALRYGFFYGPGTYYAADGSTAAQVRSRRYPVVGSGAGVFSFIHVEDAAAAVLAALEHGEPGVYNVVDDEPAPLRDWLPAYARALGARRPLWVPKFVAGLAGKKREAEMATSLRGAGNAKARRELRWTPRYRSWREGFVAELGG